MKFTQIEHQNIEQFKHMLSFNIETIQTSAGLLNATRKNIIMSHLTLFHRQESASTTTTCFNHENQFVIGLPAQNILVNGHQLSNSELFLVAPKEVVHHPLPTNFQAYGLSFNVNAAHQYLGSRLVSVMIQQAENIRTGKVKLNNLEIFRQTIVNWFTQIEAKKAKLSSIEEVQIQNNIFDAIAMLFQSLLEEPVALQSVKNRRRIMTSAIEQLSNEAVMTTSVSQLAQKCFCSVRSLEYAFQDIVKMTPKQYIAFKKLHFLRHAILHGNFSSLSELGKHYGVTNLGRLSQHYFNLFGEYPKQTWQKV